MPKASSVEAYGFKKGTPYFCINGIDLEVPATDVEVPDDVRRKYWDFPTNVVLRGLMEGQRFEYNAVGKQWVSKGEANGKRRTRHEGPLVDGVQKENEEEAVQGREIEKNSKGRTASKADKQATKKRRKTGNDSLQWIKKKPRKNPGAEKKKKKKKEGEEEEEKIDALPPAQVLKKVNPGGAPDDNDVLKARKEREENEKKDQAEKPEREQDLEPDTVEHQKETKEKQDKGSEEDKKGQGEKLEQEKDKKQAEDPEKTDGNGKQEDNTSQKDKDRSDDPDQSNDEDKAPPVKAGFIRVYATKAYWFADGAKYQDGLEFRFTTASGLPRRGALLQGLVVGCLGGHTPKEGDALMVADPKPEGEMVTLAWSAALVPKYRSARGLMEHCAIVARPVGDQDESFLQLQFLNWRQVDIIATKTLPPLPAEDFKTSVLPLLQLHKPTDNNDAGKAYPLIAQFKPLTVLKPQPSRACRDKKKEQDVDVDFTENEEPPPKKDKKGKKEKKGKKGKDKDRNKKKHTSSSQPASPTTPPISKTGTNQGSLDLQVLLQKMNTLIEKQNTKPSDSNRNVAGQRSNVQGQGPNVPSQGQAPNIQGQGQQSQAGGVQGQQLYQFNLASQVGLQANSAANQHTNHFYQPGPQHFFGPPHHPPFQPNRLSPRYPDPLMAYHSLVTQQAAERARDEARNVFVAQYYNPYY